MLRAIRCSSKNQKAGTAMPFQPFVFPSRQAYALTGSAACTLTGESQL
jgi:hypothetical protein